MKTFLVGGAVRDHLLGLAVSERDWVVVGATPKDMDEQGFRQVGREFPVFLHPDTSEEYALARTERKRGHGHRGFEVHSSPDVTLEEDLRRRDLTVNAIAQSADGALIDPYGGQSDLADRLLRHVSDAFTEDPLRVLRVARFAARFNSLGFRIADETLALMTAISQSGELLTLSAERIWSETERALSTESPWIFFDALTQCQAAEALFPELLPIAPAIERLQKVSANSEDCTLRFAALLSGLPKPSLDSLCERLNAPKRYRELASLWCNHQQTLLAASNVPANERLALLEHCDALRRPERFTKLLELLAVWAPDADTAFWDRNRECMANVDAAAIAAQGYAGHEIAARLKEQRIAELDALFD